ncbi:MAG: class I SAM-dependent DNA methyltransferase [Armatimonadota bacterium]
MQEYGEVFARVYDNRWAGFARRVAPAVLDFLAARSVDAKNRSILDLCCGTGQFSIEALKRGYRLVGVDASEAMLRHAARNTAPFVEASQARFVCADARDFTLDEQFGAAVALYDSLNHLDGENELRACLRRVAEALVPSGYFIFDLNTRARLEKWTGVTVTDEAELMLVSRSMYIPEQSKAYARISGFVRGSDHRYDRFSETFFNTAFDLQSVEVLLQESGWYSIYFAREPELATPISTPESEDRVFVIARKS